MDLLREQQLWNPTIMERVTEQELTEYLDLSCTSCLPGSGRNLEYALHVLHESKGDVKLATSRLLNPNPQSTTTTTSSTFEQPYWYTDTCKWTENEVNLFERLLVEHEKNFFEMSRTLKTKTVKQCIEFYYFWKLHHHQHQQPQFQQLQPLQPLPPTNNAGAVSKADVSSSASSTTNQQPVVAIAMPQAANAEVFPCKICGRIFAKIKSRSAHMKRHKNEQASKTH